MKLPPEHIKPIDSLQYRGVVWNRCDTIDALRSIFGITSIVRLIVLAQSVNRLIRDRRESVSK